MPISSKETTSSAQSRAPGIIIIPEVLKRSSARYSACRPSARDSSQSIDPRMASTALHTSTRWRNSDQGPAT